ncbi:MAG: type III pantothenate kinase [Erysipelotrichaceae bacterium]|nr:type III pantothenate kinase [Erysipelotrichaceae bacterium]
MLLAVDMGNTNIEFGLVEDGKILLSERVSTDLNKTETEYAVLLHNIFEIRGIDETKIEDAIISSVVPPLTHYLREAIKKVTGMTALIIEPGIKTGLKIKAEDPKAIGADLIVGSAGALELYGAPCLIIDMGTATTVVAVDKSGTFLGGAVIPGVMLSLKALGTGTSQLPMISLEAPKKVINAETIPAMQSGIVFGQASLLDGMIERMQKELGYNTKVVATGGLAKVIVPYCKSDITLDNDLMLKGLEIIYRKNKK